MPIFTLLVNKILPTYYSYILNSLKIMKSTYYIALFFVLITSLSSCRNAVKAPEFKTMEHVKFGGMTTSGATIKAEAVFNNPNRMGVELTNTDLNILVNEKNAAHVTQAYQIKVPAKSDFRVPVDINITPSQIWSDGWGFLTGKKVKIHYQGFVTVKALKLNFKVPVDFAQDIDISMFNQ